MIKVLIVDDEPLARENLRICSRGRMTLRLWESARTR